jgi:hypothetical protein
MSEKYPVGKAEIIQVIKTVAPFGAGTKEDPVRLIFQYWDMEGNLLAVRDYTKEYYE